MENSNLAVILHNEPVNAAAQSFDAIARFYADHPEVKAPIYHTVHVFLDTKEEMETLLNACPDAKVRVDATAYFEAQIALGNFLLLYMIEKSKVGSFEDREVTTTQPVWVPISDAFAIVKE